MKAEIISLVKKIEENIELLKRHLDWETAIVKLDDLDLAANDPDLWSNQEQAQKVLKEREILTQKISQIKSLESDLSTAVDMIKLAEMENDGDILKESEDQIAVLAKDIDKLQLETLLSGEADGNSCFLEINAGAGGTEAQDWAHMLGRMYSRWADTKKYKVDIMNENPGEEAGIKSITLKIVGHQAYGWLKAESGVHRLVRISPFDSNARRHTSFASVCVYPEIDDSIDVTIEEKDIRIDTFRASGAGGQHVNTTDSAIRITHIPTSIVVQCQNDRSQHKNKATALKMLKARLYEFELRTREEAAMATSASKTEIGWGHQIRSYVLQPYQMVKDARTGVEKGNAHAVLDGDLDLFLEASLSHKISG